MGGDGARAGPEIKARGGGGGGQFVQRRGFCARDGWNGARARRGRTIKLYKHIYKAARNRLRLCLQSGELSRASVCVCESVSASRACVRERHNSCFGVSAYLRGSRQRQRRHGISQPSLCPERACAHGPRPVCVKWQLCRSHIVGLFIVRFDAVTAEICHL